MRRLLPGMLPQEMAVVPSLIPRFLVGAEPFVSPWSWVVRRIYSSGPAEPQARPVPGHLGQQTISGGLLPILPGDTHVSHKKQKHGESLSFFW